MRVPLSFGHFLLLIQMTISDSWCYFTSKIVPESDEPEQFSFRGGADLNTGIPIIGRHYPLHCRGSAVQDVERKTKASPTSTQLLLIVSGGPAASLP